MRGSFAQSVCTHLPLSTSVKGTKAMVSASLICPEAAETTASTRRPAGLAAPQDFAHRLEDEIPFLRRAARRWHRDPADAEDLVQDTLVQALACADQWQPGSELRAWLYTIMRNRFFALTARSKRSAAAIEHLATADPQPAANASELRLLLRDLAAALRRLPSNQRSAVMLIGVQEKTYDEAAQDMGTTVGAVRSHLMRGRGRLKTAVRGSDARPPFAPRPSAAGAGTT
jgi:RNA polymerase sigma-70 factor (ECF subfamily)